MLLVSLVIVQGHAAESRKEKPNILVILLDDLGKEWVSCYGADGIKTPTVDHLAATGTQFHNFYVMPQCTPTRVSLLTGQYPFRHGWVNHWDVPRWGGGAHFDPKKNPSIGKVMKKAGYKTAAAGKWQIDDFRVEPEAMVEAGFDEYCMWTGYEAGVKANAERYQDPYVHTKDGSKTHNGKFGDDVFTDFLIDFMGKHREEPMFLYFPMCLPHSPLVPTPAKPDAKDKRDKHIAMVEYTDLLTGRLVKALEDLGLREDTIIVWLTDNGTGGVRGTIQGRPITPGKAKTSESGVCVPLIVNCPGRVTEGRQSKALMTVADFLTTFAELAGVDPDPAFTYDGKPCAKALLGKSDTSPHSWILSMGGQNRAKRTDQGVENEYRFRDRVIRDENYKLFVDSKGQPSKLFHLTNDSDEKANLIGSEDSNDRKALAKLSAVIAGFPKQDADPIYQPNPKQAWDVAIKAESQVWKK